MLLLMLPVFYIAAILGAVAGGFAGWVFNFIFCRQPPP